MGDRRKRLDSLVGKLGDRHRGALAIALSGLDAGIFDELIEQAFDIVELATDDPVVAIRLWCQTVLKALDCRSHRREGCAQIVTDAGEQQLPASAAPHSFSRGLISAATIESTAARFADLVVSAHPGARREVAGGNTFGHLAESGDVDRQWPA